MSFIDFCISFYYTLKQAGFDNIRFVDAMTNYIADDVLAEIIAKNQPDVVLATAITPMIYQSQKTLQIFKEVCPVEFS